MVLCCSVFVVSLLKNLFDIARFYFNSFLSKRYFLVLFSDFSLSSSQETNITPSPSAAWTIAHLSRRAGTIPWTASAANCRRFSGAVTESPIHLSRFPNCPPTVTTALSVASGTTWKPSWRKGPSIETTGRRRKRERWGCRAEQLPSIPLSFWPHLPLLHATAPHQLMSHTLSLVLWGSGDVLMEVI